MATLGLWALQAGACATAPTAKPEADPARTVEQLRAQNAAYARRIEELENQVFVLTDRLDSQQVRHEQAAAPRLPEVKLHPGVPAAPAEPAEPPISLVAESGVEFAGEALKQSKDVPVLRLVGEGGMASVEAPAPSAPRTLRRARAATPTPALTATTPVASAREMVPARGTGGGTVESAVALYQRALERLRAGQHGEAVDGFREFVERHATHDYADNAQYWLGECFYDRKEFSAALREFRLVAERFPQGNKVPDALLKMAFSYMALGSTLPARQTLDELVRSYPKHPAAALAAAKLAELERPGPGASLSGQAEAAP